MMKKRVTDIIWGLSLSSIGCILFGNIFDFWFLDIFNDGWWTLFIIIPAFISLLINSFKVIDIILVIVGISSLVIARDILTLPYMVEIVLILFVLIMGIKLIINGFKRTKKTISNDGNINNIKFSSVFGSLNEKCSNNSLKNAKIRSIFGNINLDLSDIKIKENIKIRAVCIFGSINLTVGNDVKVEIIGNNVFSNINNSQTGDKKNTIYLSTCCILGNIKIHQVKK